MKKSFLLFHLEIFYHRDMEYPWETSLCRDLRNSVNFNESDLGKINSTQPLRCLESVRHICVQLTSYQLSFNTRDNFPHDWCIISVMVSWETSKLCDISRFRRNCHELFTWSIWFFPKCFQTCHPTTSCVRVQDATTAPARHMWKTRSLNWPKFMLLWLDSLKSLKSLNLCSI